MFQDLFAQKLEAFNALEKVVGTSVFTDYQSLDNWDSVYKEVGEKGTDVAKNAEDLIGDGDQTPFRMDQSQDDVQFYRSLWCSGGDLIFLGRRKAMNPFITMCTIGNVEGCEVYLDRIPSAELKVAMLEGRHCILRQSAIFFAIVGYLNGVAAYGDTGPSNHLGVVKLLIKHGARCDARDLCGKTVLHYCLGRLNILGHSDKILLEMADLCIARTQELNISPRLVDMPDRFGDVPTMEACMMNRPDLISFLCEKHRADPTINNMHNMNLMRFCMVFPVINDIVNKAKNKFWYAEQRSTCAYCQTKSPEILMKCGKCKIAAYCNRDCQVKHWKVHKHQCSPGTSQEIHITPTNHTIMNPLTMQITASFKGLPPKNGKVDEYFDVKIQLPLKRAGLYGQENVVDLRGEFMLYNKERDVLLNIRDENCLQKEKLGEMVKGFALTGGLKAYFRAKVTAKGVLVVATDTMFVRKW